MKNRANHRVENIKIGYIPYVIIIFMELGFRIAYRDVDFYQIIASILIFSIPIINFGVYKYLQYKKNYDDKMKEKICTNLDTFLFFTFPIVYARYILERNKLLSWQIIIFGIMFGIFAILIFNGLNCILSKSFKSSE